MMQLPFNDWLMTQLNCEVDKNTLVTQIISEISGYEFALYENFFPAMHQHKKSSQKIVAELVTPSSIFCHSVWERIGTLLLWITTVAFRNVAVVSITVSAFKL